MNNQVFENVYNLFLSKILEMTTTLEFEYINLGLSLYFDIFSQKPRAIPNESFSNVL